MKKAIYIVIFTMTLILSNCSNFNSGNSVSIENNVKIYKNAEVTNKNFKYNTKEIFSLGGLEDELDTNKVFNTISTVRTDSEGNFFILDRRKANIKKFSSTGDFVLSVGTRGTGPGEMQRPSDMVIVEDTVYVSDMRARKVLKFDNDGKFINDIFMPRETGSPRSFEKINNDKFIGLLSSVARNSGARIMTMNLAILDKEFKILHSLYSESFEFDRDTYNPLDHEIEYTATEKNIYIAENSNSKYSINEYDLEGNHISTIKKNYARIRFSEEEIAYQKEIMEKRFRRSNFDLSTITFKNSIRKLYIDKYGNVVVESAQKTDPSNQFDFIVDIFKDGLLLNTVNLNSNSDFYKATDDFNKVFTDDKIIILDDTNLIVKAYAY